MLVKSTNKSVLFPEWPVSKVLAFSSTKHSPDSTKLATSKFPCFNLGLHVGDDPKSVIHNRQLLLDLLPLDHHIQWLDQVHGNNVLEITCHSEKPLSADAMITREKKLALAIMTADCLPILLASESGDEVAAIHGGWRSLAKDIISKTLALMKTDNEHINAWLGPCISEKFFEVGEEVKNAFVNQSPLFSAAFKVTNKNKYLANLQLIAKLQLAEHGITNISAQPDCTFEREDKYYSFRRDKATGRMATIICCL